jgi:hypothetical protein
MRSRNAFRVVTGRSEALLSQNLNSDEKGRRRNPSASPRPFQEQTTFPPIEVRSANARPFRGQGAEHRSRSRVGAVAAVAAANP